MALIAYYINTYTACLHETNVSFSICSVQCINYVPLRCPPLEWQTYREGDNHTSEGSSFQTDAAATIDVRQWSVDGPVPSTDQMMLTVVGDG